MRAAFTLAALIVLATLALVTPAQAGDPLPSPTEREFVGLLNAQRVAAGLARVEISPALTDIADDYAAFYAQSGSGIDHANDPPYTARANAAGCTKWDGPVLAQGYPTAQAVLDGWLSSPGHRDVLMDPGITHIGPGFNGAYALAYGMPCIPSALNTSGDFGGFELTVGKISSRGRTIKVRVEATAGSATASLAATRRGKTVRGQATPVSAGAGVAKLKVKVPTRGKWRLKVVAGDLTLSAGKIAV